jgi:hypothetical protein
MCDCGGELTEWCFDCSEYVCDDCGCLSSFDHYPFNDNDEAAELAELGLRSCCGLPSEVHCR